MTAEGQTRLLRYMVNQETPENLVLKLYLSGPAVPGDSDKAGDYHEVAGAGYEPVTMKPRDWVVRGQVAEGKEQLFQFSGKAGMVAGYYVVGLRAGILWGAQPFRPSAFDVRFDGDQIRVTPKIKLR